MIFLEYPEENKNVITYDENWQSVTEPEYPSFVSGEEQPEQPEISEKKKPYKPEKRRLLLGFQLAFCALTALAAFALKGLGGEVYQTCRMWYYNNLNDTAVFDKAHDFDLSSLFTSTKDEA